MQKIWVFTKRRKLIKTKKNWPSKSFVSILIFLKYNIFHLFPKEIKWSIYKCLRPRNIVCCILWNLSVIPPNTNAHRSVTTCHSNTHAMAFINYSLDVIESDVQINRPGYWPFAKNYGHSSWYTYSETESYVISL